MCKETSTWAVQSCAEKHKGRRSLEKTETLCLMHRMFQRDAYRGCTARPGCGSGLYWPSAAGPAPHQRAVLCSQTCLTAACRHSRNASHPRSREFLSRLHARFTASHMHQRNSTTHTVQHFACGPTFLESTPVLCCVAVRLNVVTREGINLQDEKVSSDLSSVLSLALTSISFALMAASWSWNASASCFASCTQIVTLRQT